MVLARVRGPGHPDIACDLVASAIAEEYLRRDPQARLDIRVMGGRGVLFVSGDILSQADFDVSAVVRRVLAQCGYLTQIEPFIAFEQMSSAWGPNQGSRDPLTVHGFAVKQTPDRFPKPSSLARRVAQLLEKQRQEQEEWYWLGNDYEVAVDADDIPTVWIRAPHVDQMPLAHARQAISSLCERELKLANVKVNLAGEETRSGLAERIGSSGKSASLDQYGLSVPSNPSGVGLHITHPLNMGVWLARGFARALIEAGHGQAIQVGLGFGPLDVKPISIRIRNERGEDLSHLIHPDQADLSRMQPRLGEASLLTNAVRAPFDPRILLPWEDHSAML